MPEGSARRDEIVSAARAILDEEGPGGLTMRAVATRVGIRAPSLYSHFASKEVLEAAIAADAFEELGAAMRGAPDLHTLGRAYRAHARAHPHLYRLVNDRPLGRDLLPAGLEARTAEPLVWLAGGDGDLARAIWAFAHGMTMLELAGRFPPGADLDAAWSSGIAALSPPPATGDPL